MENYIFSKLKFTSVILFFFALFIIDIPKSFASDNSNLHLGFQVSFLKGQTKSLDLNKKTLNSFAVFLKKNPSIKLKLLGFSDLTGNKTTDQKIALRRAESIRNNLISLGVNAKQLKTNTLTELEPIIKNKKVFGQKQNRTVIAKVETTDTKEIIKIINWSQSSKNLYVADPMGNRIKNLALLKEMFESQNLESVRIPANSK